VGLVLLDRKSEREREGGIEKLAQGIGRATQVTLKSDVDSPGNISPSLEV
jgi:hypothetical protein